VEVSVTDVVEAVVMTAGGVTYSTVEIGNQIWTASNVSIVPRDRFGAAMNEGRPLPASGLSSDWEGSSWVGADGNQGEYYTYYFGTSGSDWGGTVEDEDGYYYTWYAAQNVCPAGWRLPSDQDWTELTDFVGNPRATNLLAGGSSGFNAKLVGQPHSNRGERAYFWSSTLSYSRLLRPGWPDSVNRISILGCGSSCFGAISPATPVSVRCLKNN
jgi:uncharacterized protein (TIGR02145 family)